jgi:hypothetical protein
MMARWNPWRALRERHWLRLIFAPLPRSAGKGALLDIGGERIIVLDEELGRRDRNAVLGHELIHDERNILYTADTPLALVVKEEAFVNRTNARRLVPAEELLEVVARRLECGEAVTVREIEEEFDVPWDVATLALWLLAQRPASKFSESEHCASSDQARPDA